MIWIEILCDGCSKVIVNGAKTSDGAEFIAKQKGALCDDDKHFCPSCQTKAKEFVVNVAGAVSAPVHKYSLSAAWDLSAA